MKTSLNWLKKYVDIRISEKTLAEKLTMAGFEVESVEKPGEKYEHFVIGHVQSVEKHPFADRLTVCGVDTGDGIRQIICGAPNVSPGQCVVVGLPGAVVPHDQHDPEGKPFTLTQAKIRNVDSFGMICSEFELGLGPDKEGILVLSEAAAPGTPAARYFGLEDTIFEIGITPNRPDAMSHIGLAREIAAIFGKKLKNPSYKVKTSKIKIGGVLKVKVLDPDDCPRYSARVVRNVKVGESPKWLRDLLTRIGIRPVNNIVDITNYVLMEFGHPLHAFDYDRISEKTIVVRRAKEGEKFVTLDHKERGLSRDTLLICDPVKAIALAGVMGGLNSEISGSTKDIIIESAYFNPRSIRKTSKLFGLSTDASQRFERGADPNATLIALDRAASLIAEICGGEILNGVVDMYKRKITKRRVVVRLKKLNEILGTSLGVSTIKDILNKLMLEPKVLGGSKGDTVKVQCTIPTFRPDIAEEIDLIEEVARVHGYNNIPEKPSTNLLLQSEPQAPDFSAALREWLIGGGYREVINNSMQDIPTAMIASGNIVRIANPISNEMAAMRTSMLPGMLGVIRHNIFHGTRDLRLFEFGKVYMHAGRDESASPDGTYNEEPRFILAWSGCVEPGGWDRKSRNFDIFDAKGEIDSLGRKISLDNIKFIPYSTTDPLTQTGLRIEIQGCYAGSIGLVHKKILDTFEIEQDVYFAELLTDVLLKGQGEEKTFTQLPRFPVVERDLALVVDKSVPHESVLEEFYRAKASFLRSADLFDIYTGDQIGEGKKSLAYRLYFMADDHTLSQGEIDNSVRLIIQQVASVFNASIRQ